MHEPQSWSESAGHFNHRDTFLSLLVLVLPFTPNSKILDQLLLDIVHVEARAAESQGGEGHLRNKLGCVLQDRHNLVFYIFMGHLIITFPCH